MRSFYAKFVKLPLAKVNYTICCPVWMTKKPVETQPEFPRNPRKDMTALNDSQKTAVSGWIRDGQKLSEIQQRISKEFELRLTYMEVRLLVDDLKLVPKDIDPPLPPAPAVPPTGIVPGPQSATPPSQPPALLGTGAAPAGAPGAAGAKPVVVVDKVTRPGTLASGSVTFTDGQQAMWYLDQRGQLGMVPAQKGYRPPAADVEEFQLALEQELARLGM
ncbi:MAG: hypothetical protein EXS36_18015 [Pedosphaera sp.]|nr:hypothetical protein [Pedosphaera sp.]